MTLTLWTLNDSAFDVGVEMVQKLRKKLPPQVEETFGERLARLRKSRGFTQTELGEQVGLSQRMMTYYEREAERPPAYVLLQLAEVLGVTIDQLLGRRPVKNAPAPKNSRLWRKLREIEKLPSGDRKALMRTIDAFLTRTK